MDEKKTLKVMLIDDEVLILDIYIQRFQQSGCEVSSFTKAEEALASLQGGYTPDVILFDISMPGMRGYEFIETVKKGSLAPHAVMIALTNEAKDEDLQRITDLGADAHYVKASLSPSEVIAKVQELLAKKSA